MSEAGAWPNAALAFSRWTPARGGPGAGILLRRAPLRRLTPLLVAAMAPLMPWRAIFACGAVGFVGGGLAPVVPR
jgi:hypothetical protein